VLLAAALTAQDCHAFSPIQRQKTPLPSQSAMRVPLASKVAVQMTGAGGAAEESDESGTGTATIPNEVFNLVKSIVGAGVLSLPAGIAAMGNAPSVLIPASVLIGCIGLLSGYTFSMIGRVCSMTNSRSFAQAWDRTVGEDSSWMIAFSCFVDCFAGILSYSMILGDTFKRLLATCGVATSRSNAMMGVTGLILLPLCLLKNLSSLAPFSLVGIIGMMYTAVAIGIRYFGGAYAVGGKFLPDVAASMQPAFGTVGAAGVLSPNSLILVCMLSTAYIAHFNAPKFYVELKNNTVSRFNKVTKYSFGISVAIYAAISAMGFLTFGSASDGLILNNYSNKDILMTLSRFAVAVSIVFSYVLFYCYIDNM
jgi:amino acid permease